VYDSMYGIRLLGLLLLSGTLVQASDASNFSQDVLKKNDPSKTVIAFDVHGVICSFDWGRFAANGAAIVGLGGLIYANTGARWTAAYAAIYGLFGLYLGGKVLWRYLSDGYKPAVGELLFTGDPGIVFKPMFRYFAGMFKPVPEMYELMQELHKLGYKLILASNVCPDSLSDLQKLCPALRECVDGKFCPGSQPQYAADPLFDCGWMTKSNPRYFIGLRSYVAKTWPGVSQVILVDDKLKNIERAKAGNQAESALQVAGVLFASVADLREFLKSKGIL